MPKIKKYNSSKRTYTYKRNFSSGYSYSGKKRKNSSFKKIFSFTFKLLKPVLILGTIFVVIFYAFKFTSSKIYASDMLLIENIEVNGCKNVVATEIKELVYFKVGDKLLRINLSRAQKEIQKEKPELKMISMSRSWKNKSVSIELVERKPEVFIYQNKNLFGLDFDNMPFPLIGNMVDTQVPVLKYKTVPERTELLNFIKISKPYMDSFFSQIKEIYLEEITNDVVFITREGAKIFFGQIKKNDIENKIKKMLKILNDSNKRFDGLEYVDLTFLDLSKNKVIVKSIQKEQDTK
jgi:hypothetical protein